MGAGVRHSSSVATYNIPVVRGASVAIIGPFKKGRVDEFNPTVSPEDFIKKSTPNEWIDVGFHECYYDALSILEHTSRLGFVRAANNPLYGGAYLRSSGSILPNNSLSTGLRDIDEYDLDAKDGRPLIGKQSATTIISSNVSEIIIAEAFIDSLMTGDKIVFSVEEGGSLPKEIVAGNEYFAIKDDGKFYIAKTLEDAKLGNKIVFKSDIISDAFALNTSIISEESSDIKTCLISDSTPGKFDTSIKVYHYREEEVITINDDSTFSSNQNWESGESIKFISSGTLPSGLESYINYYIVKVDKNRFALATNYNEPIKSNPVTLEFGSEHTGSIKLIPSDMRSYPGCVLIEVYNNKSRNTPVESHICSRTNGFLDGNGRNTYIVERLKSSNYVSCVDNISVDPSILPKAQPYHLFLGGGSEGGPVTTSDMIRAAQCLRNESEVDILMISDGGWSVSSFHNELADICRARKDCISIGSVPYSTTVSANAIDEMIGYRTGNLDSSGGVMSTRFASIYAPWAIVTDSFNDRDIPIPLSGLVIGQICKNGLDSRLWRVPAGKAGTLNVKGLTCSISFTKDGGGDIDRLERAQINPAIKQNNGSYELWGNSTLDSSGSDASWLHASLALIVIEPAIINALRDSVIWEFKGQILYDEVETRLRAYLETMKSDMAVEDFIVICNSSNNSDADGRAKTLNVDVATVMKDHVHTVNYRHTVSRDVSGIVSVSSQRL